MDDHHQQKKKHGRAESEEQSTLPEVILWEILKRLTIKNLFRCMSVSKLCRSIILNPSFNEFYQNYQNNPIIHVHQHRSDGCFRLHSYSKLETGGGERMNLLSLNHVKECSQIVNGFICIEFWPTRHVSLFNIWRGKITQLPNPIPLDEELGHTTFHLGFESVSKVYKLLKISQNSIHGCSKRLQILTIDQDMSSSWRTLPAECLSSYYALGSVLVEGSLFWISLSLKKIICFHLMEEKFVLIELPALHPYYFLNTANIFQFRKKLALFEKAVNKLVIYSLEDDDAWMKHVFMFDTHECFISGIPVGNTDEEELILFANDRVTWTNDSRIEVYSYNYINGLLKKYVLEMLLPESNNIIPPLVVSCMQPHWSL